jgi:hypothetical protein
MEINLDKIVVDLTSEAKQQLLIRNNTASLEITDLFLEIADECDELKKRIYDELEKNWIVVIKNILEERSSTYSEFDKEYVQKYLINTLQSAQEDMCEAASFSSALRHNAASYSHKVLGIDFHAARKERVQKLREFA